MRALNSRPGSLIIRYLCLFIFSSLFASSEAASQQRKNSDELNNGTQNLQQLVKDVFRGENLVELKSSINLGAFMVEGSSYQSLFESLYGEHKSPALAQERNRQIVFMHVIMDDGMNAAHLVTKTEAANHADPRFHSVFFMKSKSGKWQIQNWHTSN